MTKQQHKLISELKEFYRGINTNQTYLNLMRACSQLKLAEFCRTLGIGIKKYKANAAYELAHVIHSN